MYLDGHGTATRAEFAWWCLFVVSAAFLTTFVLGLLLPSGLADLFFVLINLGVFLIPTMSMASRRAHDFGASGYHCLWLLVPFVGWVATLVFLFKVGGKGENAYTPDATASQNQAEHEPETEWTTSGSERETSTDRLSSASAYTERGDTYVASGQYEVAVADYTEAIRLDPSYPLAYGNRGFAYRRLGRYEEAITDYTEAIRLNPSFELAYCNRGNAYRRLERYQEAITDYTDAIRLDPSLARAYSRRANSYEATGQKQKAEQDRKAVERLRSSK